MVGKESSTQLRLLSSALLGAAGSVSWLTCKTHHAAGTPKVEKDSGIVEGGRHQGGPRVYGWQCKRGHVLIPRGVLCYF